MTNHLSEPIINKTFQRTDRLSSQFIRYTVVGGIAFAADACLLYILTRFFGVHYLTSAAFAFCLGLTINYALSVLWVFNKRLVKNKTSEFFLFALIGIAGLGLNQVFLWFFTEIWGFYFMVSKFFSAILVYLWNFSVRRFFLFR